MTNVQVENKFKTVMKKKKQTVDSNHTIGASKINIPYESEVLRSSIDELKLLKPTNTLEDIYDLPST